MFTNLDRYYLNNAFQFVKLIDIYEIMRHISNTYSFFDNNTYFGYPINNFDFCISPACDKSSILEFSKI